MPIYDYHCDHCGHSFSAVRPFKDKPLDKCPNCGRQPRQLFTPPAIVFKGSGWYKTDSRTSSQKAEKSEGKPDAAKGDAKTEKKSDGKTEKPPPKSEAAS